MEQGNKWWHYCRQTPYYEKILLNLTKKDDYAVAPIEPIVKKITCLGVPLLKIKKSTEGKKIWFAGIRLFKTKRRDNLKKFYFLWFRLSTMKIQKQT